MGNGARSLIALVLLASCVPLRSGRDVPIEGRPGEVVQIAVEHGDRPDPVVEGDSILFLRKEPVGRLDVYSFRAMKPGTARVNVVGEEEPYTIVIR